MRIEKIKDPEEKVWFEDKDSGRKFIRIIGGLGWGGVKPGCVVVVGEDFDEDPVLQIRRLRIFGEAESKSPNTLFQKSLELRDRYRAQDFYANIDNEPMMDLLYYYNQDLKDMSHLHLSRASFPEDLGYHNIIVEEYLDKKKRKLHFEDKRSVLKSYLLGLFPGEAIKGDVCDYPAIAALGYAVYYLKSHPWKPKKKLRRHIEADSWKTV